MTPSRNRAKFCKTTLKQQTILFIMRYKEQVLSFRVGPAVHNYVLTHFSPEHRDYGNPLPHWGAVYRHLLFEGWRIKKEIPPDRLIATLQLWARQMDNTHYNGQRVTIFFAKRDLDYARYLHEDYHLHYETGEFIFGTPSNYYRILVSLGIKQHKERS